jgi:hypothetical protein
VNTARAKSRLFDALGDYPIIARIISADPAFDNKNKPRAKREACSPVGFNPHARFRAPIDKTPDSSRRELGKLN